MECKKQIAVSAQNVKYFNDAEEARRYAIKLLEAGLTYITIDEHTGC